ncbi:MAG: hypothetical protein ACRED1_01835, partial [Limisphaerales bacterium]
PLDVEKWWALQTVIFSARSHGPRWTAAVSRQKLDQILSVAADFRSMSNSLPVRVQISLQDVIRNFNTSAQRQVLQLKLLDLEVAQFRMAPSLAVLTAEYRRALAAYLGKSQTSRRGLIVNKSSPDDGVSVRETLRILNALDARRRSMAMTVERGSFE